MLIMNKSIFNVLFISFLLISFTVYFFHFLSFQFVLQEQVDYFLMTTDFLLPFLNSIHGVSDYIASFLMQFYAIRYVGGVVLLVFVILIGFLSNELLKPFTDSSYRLPFSFLFATAFIWQLHCHFSYPLSNDVGYLISLTSCLIYIRLKHPRMRYLFGGILSLALWYICKEAAFTACLYIVFYEIKEKRKLACLLIIPIMFVLSSYFTSLLFPENVITLSEYMESTWYYAYMFFIISLPCGAILSLHLKKIILLFPVYILLIIDGCCFRVDYDRQRELSFSYCMQHGEWNELLKKIDNIKELNLDQLNYYYMALAQTGKLSDQLFQYGFPFSEALIYPVAGSYISKTRLSDIYWYLGCFRASQFYATEAMSMLDAGANTRHIKRLAMIHLIYKENEQAMKFLRILKKTALHNRWAVKLLNHMQNDPDLNEVEWIAAYRRLLPVHTYQINLKSPLENVTNLSMQLPFATLALEYANNLALLEKKVDWLVNMVRYKKYLIPTIKIPALWQEGVLASEYENNIQDDSQLEIEYDEDVLKRFEEFKALKRETATLYSNMIPFKNEFKSSYFYYHVFVDINK